MNIFRSFYKCSYVFSGAVLAIFMGSIACQNTVEYCETEQGDTGIIGEKEFYYLDDFLEEDSIGASMTIDEHSSIYITGIAGNIEYLNVGGHIHYIPNQYMQIWKYSSEGVLETAFNDDQKSGDIGSIGRDVVVDRSGAIYIVGSSKDSVRDDGRDIAIWKYRSDGELDPAFGDDGIVIFHGTEEYEEEATSVLIDDNNNVYVAGYIRDGPRSMLLLKYRSDGTPDPTFGDNGMASYEDIDGDGAKAYDMEFDSTGNLYVAGRLNARVAIWKYHPDGTLDSSFGGTGVVVYENSSAGEAKSIAVDDNDSVYATGSVWPDDTFRKDRVILLKYLSNGTLDTTFSGDGVDIQRSSIAGGGGYNGGKSILLDDAGNIYVSGLSSREYLMNYHDRSSIFVLRYLRSGEIDTAFGNNGAFTAYALGSAVGSTSNIDGCSGDLFVSGYSYGSGKVEMSLLRIR